MRIAVAGGTGLVGRYVVEALTAAGDQAVLISPSRGVDLLTGRGLSEALDEVEAVVDVTNSPRTAAGAATAFFEKAGRNLLAAEERAGVRRHLTLSVVGIDRASGFGYYRAKLAQEEVVRKGPIPWTILRATQFHEFAEQTLAQISGPVAIAPRLRSQPVAAREVGHALAELVKNEPQEYAPELAGPREEQVVEMARSVLRATRRRRLLVPLRLPGAAGAAMSGGALLPTGPGPRGVQTFEQWLAEHHH
ncbi:SDR family oxidoreductase [Streptomyces broussonetiae]|uniref:NAD(P)H-binding protein n=1 Tax=Streptomyces broussonetiae TaxID=2686304 RepID=A0A6I6N7M7_9ACTN|nr:SDR family oxidoreductase [Streptomyces broussonetiae]QHA06629.1 NAD(P)H-binding protein [Streptomyces broussonetiae]